MERISCMIQVGLLSSQVSLKGGKGGQRVTTREKWQREKGSIGIFENGGWGHKPRDAGGLWKQKKTMKEIIPQGFQKGAQSY